MSTVNRIVRTFVAASLCVALCDSVLAGDAPWSGAGPHKVVTIASLQLTDAVRGRTIEVLVRHPEGPGPYPVIIRSHGFFSNKDTFSPASEHWAGYGYVVIHPNHADARGGTPAGGLAGRQSPEQTRSRNALIRRSRVLGGGAGVANGGTSRIERIRDISSVLDSLDQVEAQIPALRENCCRKLSPLPGIRLGPVSPSVRVE
jgi:predicted dienelactone hydrolase